MAVVVVVVGVAAAAVVEVGVGVGVGISLAAAAAPAGVMRALMLAIYKQHAATGLGGRVAPNKQDVPNRSCLTCG